MCVFVRQDSADRIVNRVKLLKHIVQNKSLECQNESYFLKCPCSYHFQGYQNENLTMISQECRASQTTRMCRLAWLYTNDKGLSFSVPAGHELILLSQNNCFNGLKYYCNKYTNGTDEENEELTLLKICCWHIQYTKLYSYS